MEIRAVAFHSIRCSSYTSTQFVPPLFQVPLPLPLLFGKLHLPPSNPKSLLLTLNHPSLLFQRAPDARQFSRQPHLPATRSIADDGASVGLATPPVQADSSLQMKKKAIEISNDLKGTSIFLLGMDGAMKTSVGKVIANALRYYYFDSDRLVEEAAGSNASGKSFRERDENGFRESETEVLRQLSSMGRLLVNAGNGAVQSATNLAYMRHGISIWIDVPLDMVAQEVAENGNFIASSPESYSEVLNRLTAVYRENKEGYATADARVSVLKIASDMAYDEYDQVSAEDMALGVLSEIEKLTREKKMMEEAGRPF